MRRSTALGIKLAVLVGDKQDDIAVLQGNAGFAKQDFGTPAEALSQTKRTAPGDDPLDLFIA